MIVYIAIAVGVLLLITFLIALIIQYKKIEKLKKVVKESYSTLEVFLEKRLEIVLNLLSMCSPETIKNKEIGNLLSIAKEIQQNLQKQRRFILESSFDNACQTSITALSKVNENNAKYQQLLNNLKQVQTDVISSKNYYNNNVEAYNKKVTKAPSSWIANIFGFKKEYYIK